MFTHVSLCLLMLTPQSFRNLKACTDLLFLLLHIRSRLELKNMEEVRRESAPQFVWEMLPSLKNKVRFQRIPFLKER